jgi:hypothetical protein
VVQHFFSRFRENENEYRAAERFWSDLFEEVANRHGQSSDWVPWQPTVLVDGTPLPRDGNPIFEARSEELGRAVRVIQQAPQAPSLEIAAWVDTFDFSDADGPGFTEELVINLSLSDASARVSRYLIDQWMDRSVSRERMEDLVESLKDAK